MPLIIKSAMEKHSHQNPYTKGNWQNNQIHVLIIITKIRNYYFESYYFVSNQIT